jgi:hypothetical protein
VVKLERLSHFVLYQVNFVSQKRILVPELKSSKAIKYTPAIVRLEKPILGLILQFLIFAPLFPAK